MKKRIISCLAVILCLSLFICGCDLLRFETDRYRRMNDVYTAFLSGERVTKEEIYHKFGYPDAYLPENGELTVLPYGERENMYDLLLQPQTLKWVYYCRKYDDSKTEYALTVTFDSEGISSDVTFL